MAGREAVTATSSTIPTKSIVPCDADKWRRSVFHGSCQTSKGYHVVTAESYV